MLLVRCVLALVALVMSVLDKNLITPVIFGFLIWRWIEEGKQQIERQSEIERAGIYAAELKKWRGLMALCAAVSVVCFLVVLAKGESLNFAANNLSGLAIVSYWLFDRARAIIWFACFVSVVALVVALFGPFEFNLR